MHPSNVNVSPSNFFIVAELTCVITKSTAEWSLEQSLLMACLETIYETGVTLIVGQK